MLSDIEISRQSPRLPVHALAERLAIPPHLLHPHGHYKGKLDLERANSTSRCSITPPPASPASWCW